MAYTVKEIYLTLQGEGAQAGRAAVLCRFTGCNLWSGREADRAQASCRFCDTDFLGTDGPRGGRYAAAGLLVDAILACWREGVTSRAAQPYVVFTGGEPALQLDEALVQEGRVRGLELAVETNGTRPLPEGLDWICVSPKPRSKLLLRKGHELKLIYPQREPEMQPQHFEGLDFEHFFLQPLDDEQAAENQRRCQEYCLQHPPWRMSLQTHKILGLP